jgi:hypothetical protein
MTDRRQKMPQVSKVKKVPIRQAFPHEAHDFTVWLEDNIDSLSSQIGITLSVEEREKRLGDFRADLICRDGSGNRVIIENQLERTDHKHFGQLITYMSKLKANTAIWITPEPRAEHIEAVQNLNKITLEGFVFYLVKLEAIVIGDSLPAPLFTIVSKQQQFEDIEHLPPHPNSPIFKKQTMLLKNLGNATFNRLTREHKPPKSDTLTNPDAQHELAQLPFNEHLPPVWCFYPRRDKETYELFLSENFVGLGFGRMGDLSKLAPTPEAFKEAWNQSHPSSSKRETAIFYAMFYSLVHRIKVGDLVIYCPTWHERKIYVGQIESNYKYVKHQPKGYCDLRKVKWIAQFARDEFSPEARQGIVVNLALFNVHNKKFLSELRDRLLTQN